MSPGSCSDKSLTPEGPKLPRVLTQSDLELSSCTNTAVVELCLIPLPWLCSPPAPPRAIPTPGASLGTNRSKRSLGRRSRNSGLQLAVQVNVKAGKWPYPSEGAEFKSTVIFRSNFGMENVFQLNELVSYILLKCCSLNQLVKRCWVCFLVLRILLG